LQKVLQKSSKKLSKNGAKSVAKKFIKNVANALPRNKSEKVAAVDPVLVANCHSREIHLK
jgi:hypothetical protein